MGGASRSAVVAGPDGVSTRALVARGEAAALLLLPVWRRDAPVHRRILRVDGSDSAAGVDRATLVVRTGVGSDAGTAHHAETARPADARGRALAHQVVERPDFR